MTRIIFHTNLNFLCCELIKPPSHVAVQNYSKAEQLCDCQFFILLITIFFAMCIRTKINAKQDLKLSGWREDEAREGKILLEARESLCF